MTHGLKRENSRWVLDGCTLEERIAEGISFPVLDISLMVRSEAPQSVSTNDCETVHRPGHVVANVALQDAVADVGPGEEVSIHSGDPCSPVAMRGRVIDSEETRTLVRLKVPFAPFSSGPPTLNQLPAFDSAQGWFLDRVPFSRGRDVARQALFRFSEKADPAVVATVVGTPPPASTEPHGPSGEELSTRLIGEEAGVSQMESGEPQTMNCSSQDLCFSEGLQSELNQDQESAVRAALDCETFHLVHGPPGTGKTRVLARAIRICLDRGERVLVACPTNVALDRVLISLMNLGVRDFLRIGGSRNLSTEFLDAVERCGNPPILLEELGTRERNFTCFRQRVDEMRLIGATAYQCASHPFSCASTLTV